ncbi:MAG: KpsF/GutQ family sugar-phosphate isomerase [Bacteroidota bacterium]|nr:KpsF/GutQ family sugar-phosphate isomerase [Bacteroidota bacterium]
MDEIQRIAKESLLKEAKAIENLVNYIDEDFTKAVELIYQSKGRVIVTGIGKSANIANKIVATLNSTGTPGIFMHAADAIHGDLGIIQPEDVVIILSKSGNTPEIKVLIPLIRSFKNSFIAIVSDQKSFLATHADFVLKATVSQEACPNNLAPTSSTTAQLAIGDALAICLLNKRGFTPDDFAKVHPGGSLGKKLYLKIKDVYPYNESPRVYSDAAVDKIITEISSKRMGATAVLTHDNKLVGVITDGDLRRMLQHQSDKIGTLKAEDLMTINPKTISPDTLAVNGFKIMEENNITQLIVIENGSYLGMVHLHDFIKEGIV